MQYCHRGRARVRGQDRATYRCAPWHSPPLAFSASSRQYSDQRRGQRVRFLSPRPPRFNSYYVLISTMYRQTNECDADGPTKHPKPLQTHKGIQSFFLAHYSRLCLLKLTIAVQNLDLSNDQLMSSLEGLDLNVRRLFD